MVTSLDVRHLTGSLLYDGNYFIIDMLRKCARVFTEGAEIRFSSFNKICLFCYTFAFNASQFVVVVYIGLNVLLRKKSNFKNRNNV